MGVVANTHSLFRVKAISQITTLVLVLINLLLMAEALNASYTGSWHFNLFAFATASLNNSALDNGWDTHLVLSA